MIWDVIIAFYGIAFVIAGWHVGLRNSWQTLLAIPVASLVTQVFYLNFAAWLVDSLIVPSHIATLIGYIFLWLVVEFIAETLFVVVIPIKRAYNLSRVNCSAGALVGLSKVLVLLVCANLASVSVKGLVSPPGYPPVSVWLSEASQNSVVLGFCRSMAANLPVAIVQTIVSDKGPSFQSFRNKGSEQTSDRANHYREIFQQVKSTEEHAADSKEASADGE